MAKQTASKLLVRARQSMARARAKEKQTVHLAVEKGTSLGTAVALAMLSDKIPVSVMGLPTKLLIAGGGYVGAMLTRGNLSRAMESVGDSSSTIYAYLAAMKVKAKEAQPFIAGNEYSDDDTGFIEEV